MRDDEGRDASPEIGAGRSPARRRRLLRVLMALGLAAGGMVAVAAPASAGAGPCHSWSDGYGHTIFILGYGGWCDGTGPSSYRAYSRCNNPANGLFVYAYGDWHWYGDRRGSWAYCPSGYSPDPANMGFQ